jgi:transglutaminase-like putative cysteine protease
VRAVNGENNSAVAPEMQEFVFPSSLIRRLPALGDYAAGSFVAGRPLLEAIMDLTRRIHGDLKFDPKATTVATPLEQVIRNGRGVCQDFAHFQIGCLRAIGLPARYVSGYLETLPPPGKPKLVGADASHAWVQAFVPPVGWIDIDPTNNLIASDRYITVARGRDFDDVSPIRGVIVGGGKHELSVGVDVTPLD